MTIFGNKIIKISDVNINDFSLKIEFFDGTSGKVSLAKIFNSPQGMAAEVLKGGLFTKCFIDSGALAWPNGFELCPDTLRLWLENQEKEQAS